MMGYAESLDLAMHDREYDEHIVEHVEAYESVEPRTWGVKFDDALCCCVVDTFGVARAPKAGDIIRIFGRGFGYPFRGIALYHPDREGEETLALYRYQTAEEFEASRTRQIAKMKADRAAEWEAAKEKTLRAVAEMPEPFRKRFEFFMRTPSWGSEFGLYEVFTMQQAVTIAAALKTPAAIDAFTKLPRAEQDKLVQLDAGMTGNQLGAALTLAHGFLTADPNAEVYQFHGALCPLVGCQAYGCWSQTKEAQKAR